MSAPIAVTIAGSDPGGGAGIQADLKTFSALGAYGTSVVTALTAQNTRGVTGIHTVPADFVAQQWRTLIDDITVDAVKVGMLASAELVDLVARVLRDDPPPLVVVDPVMVATSGDRLLDGDALEALHRFLPQADIITPNLAEAALLTGTEQARTQDEVRAQAYRLRDEFGARAVLLKGGHLGGAVDVASPADPGARSARAAVDLFVDQDGDHELVAPWVETTNTHGTGCTLSSAIAALGPQRETLLQAVTDAKAWLTTALQHADELHVGHGHGPVHHFHAFWS